MNKITAKLEELFGIDIRALAMMRISFSICILMYLLDNLPCIKVFYSDEGILPRTYAIHKIGPNAICLNLISGSWVFQVLLFLMTAFFTVGLLLGWRTRLCTCMVWVLLSSLHERNPFILDGGHSLLHILFFWFLFLPWGACYSWNSRHKTLYPPLLRVSSMGSVALLLQISFFYTFAGFLKTGPSWTTQGTAIYLALNNGQFCKPFGHVLLQHHLLMQYMTFAVLKLERFGALFFFIPFKNIYFRLMAIMAFMFFHIGIMLCMELKQFQWICLIMLIGFLPTPFLNKILRPVPLKSNTPAEKQGWKPNLFYMPPYLSLIVAFFIIYVFFWNMGGLENSRFKIPHQIRWIGQTFNIYQRWNFFSPRPRDGGWCIMPAKLRDGKIVDILNSGAPVTWNEPDAFLKLYKMTEWNKYYSNMRMPNNIYYRKPWAEYVCKEWNRDHPFNQQILAFDINYVEKHILPSYQKPVFHRILLISHYCSGSNRYPDVSVFKESGLRPDEGQ